MFPKSSKPLDALKKKIPEDQIQGKEADKTAVQECHESFSGNGCNNNFPKFWVRYGLTDRADSGQTAPREAV